MLFTFINISQAAVTLPDFSSINDPGIFIDKIYIFALSIVGIIVFVRFVWAGWIYLSAAGNIGNVSKAKEMMWNAVIGAIILVSSYLILYTINPDLVGTKTETLLQVPNQDTPPNNTNNDNGGGDTGDNLITVSSVEPLSGEVGTPVLVTGTNFSNEMIVTWDGVAMEYEVDSETEFVFSVPEDSKPGGHILVVDLNGKSERRAFIVTAGN